LLDYLQLSHSKWKSKSGFERLYTGPGASLLPFSSFCNSSFSPIKKRKKEKAKPENPGSRCRRFTIAGCWMAFTSLPCKWTRTILEIHVRSVGS